MFHFRAYHFAGYHFQQGHVAGVASGAPDEETDNLDWMPIIHRRRWRRRPYRRH
jgi:hypothetical protein